MGDDKYFSAPSSVEDLVRDLSTKVHRHIMAIGGLPVGRPRVEMREEGDRVVITVSIDAPVVRTAIDELRDLCTNSD